ncbi:hypothetical protein GT755_14110 [Herbidospora sp. NEAU-GS84]|uniref:Uncharacterized protein n=1 Tax=Herbidospora solisilvae TaxID=2696284 RepID=A0A7C9JU82_9ACTN|nr:hypothetical protein [Herbidospora solisilvae]NAS22819.1 hypothetical protein [Herbidospora solisilvae]
MRGPIGKLRAATSKFYGTDHVPLDGHGHADGHGHGHGHGHDEHAAVGAGDHPRELR